MPINPDLLITSPTLQCPYVDKLGNPLITVKNKALRLEYISRFVHSSGVYRFECARLHKI